MKDVQIIEIDDKEYFLLDSISENNVVFNFFSNVDDSYDIYVLKNGVSDGKDGYIFVNKSEFLHAMTLFYEKHKNDKYEGVIA